MISPLLLSLSAGIWATGSTAIYNTTISGPINIRDYTNTLNLDNFQLDKIQKVIFDGEEYDMQDLRDYFVKKKTEKVDDLDKWKELINGKK